MQIDDLRRIYMGNEVVKAICDHMESRSNNQNETKLRVIGNRLRKEGFDQKDSEIRAAFRLLEEAGCGRYVEGRWGWESRFVWSVKSTRVKGGAEGTDSEVSLEESEEDVKGELSDELIEHSFVLRPDLVVSIDLPIDLTSAEAERLSRFVSSLSFED